MLRNIGPFELLLIVLILVLLFGARKLPELGKSIGESIKNFRTSMKEASRDDSAPEKKDDSSPAAPK